MGGSPDGSLKGKLQCSIQVCQIKLSDQIIQTVYSLTYFGRFDIWTRPFISRFWYLVFSGSLGATDTLFFVRISFLKKNSLGNASLLQASHSNISAGPLCLGF